MKTGRRRWRCAGRPSPARRKAAFSPRTRSRLGKQTLYPYSASIGVTQPLWTGGRADAAIEQADYQIKAERANLLNEEETILLQAATAYFDVYNNQAVLDLAINNVKVLTQALDEANARFKAGLATQTDVAQAEARLQSGFADQRQAEANLTNSQAVYRNVVGNWPGVLKPEPPASRAAHHRRGDGRPGDRAQPPGPERPGDAGGRQGRRRCGQRPADAEPRPHRADPAGQRPADPGATGRRKPRCW